MEQLTQRPARAETLLRSKDYKHSSAKFYLTGEDGFYKIDNVAEMKDKVLVSRENNGTIDATSGKGRDVAAK